MKATAKDLLEDNGKYLHGLDKPYAFNGKKRVLIVGDSQAGDFVNMLVENHYQDKLDLRTIQIKSECQPIIPSNSNIYENMREP